MHFLFHITQNTFDMLVEHVTAGNLTHVLYHLRVELKEPVGQIVSTDKGILAVEQNKVLVPPTWSKTFAWGYADLSCRLANYESDKVSTSSEI